MLFLRSRAAGLVLGLVLATGTTPAHAACPNEAAAQVYSGAGGTPCPCFIPGEEAGCVFSPPLDHYPLEVLRVGVLWVSQFGGAPQQLEDSIKIYKGGFPNPGLAVAALGGPVLTDGFINEFDLEPLPGEIIVDSGPVTATLKFLNGNNGDLFAPSVAYDSGCNAADNLVYAIPGGWSSACALGVPGDWVFFLVYKPCAVQTGIGDEVYAASRPVMLFPPNPNPIRLQSSFEFFLSEPGHAAISVYDVAGRPVASLADDAFAAGPNRVTWTPDADLPGGMYFVELQAAGERVSTRVMLQR